MVNARRLSNMALCSSSASLLVNRLRELLCATATRAEGKHTIIFSIIISTSPGNTKTQIVQAAFCDTLLLLVLMRIFCKTQDNTDKQKVLKLIV